MSRVGGLVVRYRKGTHRVDREVVVMGEEGTEEHVDKCNWDVF